MRSSRSLAAVALVTLLAACSSSSGTSTYSSTDIGRAIETTPATVVSSRGVSISGESNNVGPLAGGAAGAATTGILVRGRNSGLAAVLGGLAGAGAGALAQSRGNDREGIEYVLNLDDGRTVTIVQTADGQAPLPSGTPVLLQSGAGFNRVIPDPNPNRGLRGGTYSGGGYQGGGNYGAPGGTNYSGNNPYQGGSGTYQSGGSWNNPDARYGGSQGYSGSAGQIYQGPSGQSYSGSAGQIYQGQ